ncbi:MAG: GAF domain-containing protein [Gammaproteobacteria bacterium]|nr:GAF domain-containing protein [Gammaproteobacteria bacterium]
MTISRRDIVQMLRDENALLKTRNQQVSDKLSRQQQALRVLSEIDEVLMDMKSVSDVGQFIHRLLSLILHACNSNDGSLLLLDDDSDELVFAEVIGQSADQLKNQRIPKDTGIVGQSIASRKAILIKDVKKSDVWSPLIDNSIGYSTKSLLCAPLIASDSVLGAVEVVNSKGDSGFDENDLTILSVTARLVSLVLLKTESFSEVI